MKRFLENNIWHLNLFAIVALAIFASTYLYQYMWIEFGLGILLLLAVMVIIVRTQSMNPKNLSKQKNVLRSLTDDSQMSIIVSSDALTSISIDEKHRCFHIRLAEDEYGDPRRKPKLNMPYTYYTFSFDALEAVGVVVDGEIKMSTYKDHKHSLRSFVKQLDDQERLSSSKKVVGKEAYTMTLISQFDHEHQPFYLVTFDGSQSEEMKTWYQKTALIIKGSSEE